MFFNKLTSALKLFIDKSVFYTHEMLQTIRNSVPFGGKPQRRSRAVKVFSQALLALYLFVFISDAVNLDVIIASFSGTINFVDDVAISNSVLDTGSLQHHSLFDQNVTISAHQRYEPKASLAIGNDLSLRNAVYEDEDSPGIEDAQTSRTLGEHILLPRPISERAPLTRTISIDRVISFQQILI